MWRRRRLPLIRRISVARSSRKISPVDPRLIDANRLSEEGEFASAVGIYQEVAEAALRRDGPQAPYLFALVGNAWLQGNEIENAIIAYQKSLEILLERKNWKRLRILSGRIFALIKNSGHTKQEKELRSWLDLNLPANIKHLQAWEKPPNSTPNHRKLPSNCPRCGAPIDVDELEWTDESANCNYCGSLLTKD